MHLNHIPVFGPNGCIICEQERKRMEAADDTKAKFKTNKNQFQSKYLDFGLFSVFTEQDTVAFNIGGIAVRLDPIQVNNLRNLLSEWKNDKRYRDQRRENKTKTV